MIKIFLAAPISAFRDEMKYKKSRAELLVLIDKLRDKFQVYSEVLNIESLALYDEPGKSAIKDFYEISESDIFIMFHPINIQTSTLIELGYAVAKKKKIIIISKLDILPYLALGLSKYNSDVKIILSSELNEEVCKQVLCTIDNFLIH